MTPTDKKSQSRRPTRLFIIVAALVLVIGAAWWLAGRKVWTDDRGVAVVDGQAKLREVLWSPPKPLGDFFEGDQQNYEPSFSPDGTELYFVAGKPGHNADIFVSYRRNNQWSQPEPVTAINTPADELGPRVTADGKFLLFYSDRAGGFGGYDIWASPRTKDGWGKPFNLGPNVNSEFNEFTPDATPDGKHLIFATNRVAAKREQLQNWRATIRSNEVSDFDLWIAELVEPAQSSIAEAIEPATQKSADVDQPVTPATQPVDLVASSVAPTTQPTTAPAQNPEPISPDLTFGPAHEIPGINTSFVEGASCMSPAGDFLYFASNRPGGFGKFDIWRSRVSTDWRFGPVENAGSEINSADNETDPALAFNGYRLIFSSDRGSDIGTYRLFSSDSREVYAMRQGRPMPQVGRSFWIFLASLLALIPLLLMLRGWDSGRLGILQRCLLISLLVHVLLCLGLSFLYVSHDVYHFARQQLGVEVAINLNASPEMEIGTAIRRESTASDLQTHGAPPRAERITQTPLETAIAPGPVDVALPRATAMPEPVMAAADVARIVPPVKADAVSAQAAAPNPELPQNDPVNVHLVAQHAVSQAEATQQVHAAVASSVKASADLPDIAPRIAPAPTTPAVQVSTAPLPIEPGPITKVNLPAGGATDPARVQPVASSVAPAAPSVSVEQPTVEKIAGNDAAPTASTVAPRTASPGPLDAPSAHMIQGAKSDVTPTAVPAQPDASPTAAASVASTGAFHPAAGPVVQGAAAPGASNLVAPPDVDNLKPTDARLPVASGQPDAPKAQEASVGSARQGMAVASATPTGVDIPVPRVASSAVPTVGGPVAPSVISTPRAIAAGPTTLPSQNIDTAIAQGPAAPQVAMSGPQPAAQRGGVDKPIAGENSAGPASRVTGPIASGTIAPSAGAAQVGGSVAPAHADAGSALAAAPVSIAHATVPGIAGATPVAGPSAGIPAAIDAPKISLPEPMAALASPHPAASGAGANVPEPTAVAMAGKQTMHGSEGGGTKNVSIDLPGPALAGAHLPKESGTGLDPISARPHLADVPSPISPRIDIGPLPTDIGTGRLNAPDSPFTMRAPEVHRPIIEKLGGNKQSEDAVAKALFWLSEHQEDGGRWTVIMDGRRGKHPRTPHDTALTALPLLAYLAQDHRPDKPGPYRETVRLGLEYLLSAQRPDGDLRGDSPGTGAASSNMYDHGISTYAMAEAAILSHDPRYIDAALRGADFIVNSQNDETGGWRYAPRESGDTSVFGWQVMALHSAEQIGFKIPDRTRQGIDHYIRLASSGDHKMLASYLPRAGPTPTMTAQLAFTRMLLGQQLNDGEMGEASDFLIRTPTAGGRSSIDLYYWYYASLCMSQMHTPAWKSWNEKTRDALVALQKPDGEHSAYWDSNIRKGDNAGRVFSTAMGTLTLEVYYRYMPLQERNALPAAK